MKTPLKFHLAKSGLNSFEMIGFFYTNVKWIGKGGGV